MIAQKKCFISFFILNGLLAICIECEHNEGSKIRSNANEICPEKCTCTDAMTTINCKNRSLDVIPKNIPTSAKILYLGYNRLCDVEENAFVNLTNLMELYLNDNRISKIHERAFFGLSSLVTLSLTENLLTNLPGNAFEHINLINKLYLMHNSLIEIPDFTLARLKNLTILNMDTNKLKNADLCKGQKTVLFENLEYLGLSNNANISNIFTSDLACLNPKKFTRMNLSRCKLRYISPNALSFEQLQSLSLSYCEEMSWKVLQTIFKSINISKSLAALDLSGIFNKNDIKLNSSTFKFFPNSTIRYLQLQHSEDISVENGTFDNFPMLETLDFTSSNIASFQDSLGKCTKLKRLIFLHNKILKESIISNLKLPSLQTLVISDCVIENLNSKLFEGITNIVNVTIKGCRVHQIETDSFMKLTELATLDLSGNSIGGNSLPNSLFSSCSKLEYINLSSNKMTTIHSESLLFKHLYKLEHLDLSNNLCTNLISSIFQDQENLKILDLSGNNLSRWLSNDSSSGLFKPLKSLQLLNLQNNEIKVVPNELFDQLPKLRFIDLSKNEFNSFNNLLFSSSAFLQRIDLSGNKFSSVNVLMLLKLPKSSSINLNANPFDCSCDLRDFRFWIDSINLTVAENKLLNLQSYKCNSPAQLAGSPVLNFDPHSIWAFCNWFYLLIISLLLLAIILITVSLILFKYRWTIRLNWYLLKRRCNRREHGERQPLLNSSYDLAISYMEDDYDNDWVHDKLLPRLRDFGQKMERIFTYDELELGSSIIEAVPNAIFNSSKLLICLSESYLNDSRRIHYEIPLCIQSRLANSHELNGPNGIVLVLLDPEMDPTKIPKGLRVLMGNGGEAKCVHWYRDDEARQELFWDDLKKKLI